MDNPRLFQFLADAVLCVHAAIVMFVVGGLLLVVVGNKRGWSWANALWPRLAHLAAISIVIAEAWLGFVCPLTTLETWLRVQAGDTTYAGGFIEHWLHALIFWSAPPWVFSAAYTLFGLAVVVAWLRYPPNSRQKEKTRKLS